MDDNTVLPGRGTAVETAFFKQYLTTADFVEAKPTPSARYLQLHGLSLGYATAVDAAAQALGLLRRASTLRPDAQVLHAFVLRVMACMLPASRSLTEILLGDELGFAFRMHQIELRAPPAMDPTYLAVLRSKWTTSAMIAMRRARGLNHVEEQWRNAYHTTDAARRADIAEHSLKECALPSCGKLEASVQQYKFCSACRSVWYCSAEHGALHWKEHKPTCRATTAAQQARE